MTCQALYGHRGRIIISKYTFSLFISIETQNTIKFYPKIVINKIMIFGIKSKLDNEKNKTYGFNLSDFCRR